ncbi:hypothetical protein M0802_009732 [Mischocyttarus mexicanus]|nr:hypothetical protein M0802_009732 [Mischocyttarus mexicanus]
MEKIEDGKRKAYFDLAFFQQPVDLVSPRSQFNGLTTYDIHVSPALLAINRVANLSWLFDERMNERTNEPMNERTRKDNEDDEDEDEDEDEDNDKTRAVKRRDDEKEPMPVKKQ